MFLLYEAAEMQVPSGWNWTSEIGTRQSSNDFTQLLEVISQSLTVVDSFASQPEAIKRVSGENRAALTQWLWAFGMLNIKRRSASVKHLIDLSSEPEIKSCPSYERDTDLTGPEWDLITWEKPSTELFQTRIVLSEDPETIVVPVGEMSTEFTFPVCPT